MAQLIVRNLDQTVKERLAKRARLHGRSMEEEVRSILRDAVQKDIKAARDTGFGTRLAAFFQKHGIDTEIEELKGNEARPANFE